MVYTICPWLQIQQCHRPMFCRKNSGDVASEKGESIEKPAEIGSQPKSASKNTGDKPVSAEGHQKAGSGLSAFKVLDYIAETAYIFYNIIKI